MNTFCMQKSFVAVAFALLLAMTADRAAAENWPYEIESPDSVITVYQPQIDAFTNGIITSRAAVSVKQAGSAEPVFGAVWLRARVETDRDTRMASFADIAVTDMKFPNATDEQKQKLSAALRDGLEKRNMQIAQDRLLAMVETAEKKEASNAPLQVATPTIIFATNPAVLVTFDGEPKLRPLPGSGLMRIVNTPFLIVLDTNAFYYLKGGAIWYAAKAAKGPWTRTDAVPAPIAALVTNEPPSQDGAETPQPPPPRGSEPRIIVATEPTELVSVDGAPEFGALAGTGFLYVQNTESDILLDIQSQRMYVLLSGRWYGAPGPNGPWEYVPGDKLPQDIANIPADSPKADVRAHVPGTSEARDAALDALIPQTATVPRGQTNLPVAFDGEPKFEGTGSEGVQYAVNSPHSVVLVGGRYYCCIDGVWYVTEKLLTTAERTVEGVLNLALGTVWAVCDVVPAVIYGIPPSCPIYPVTYCRVYDCTPDVVYVGYTPGYLGCYVWGGCVVYGTGYLYHPWYGPYWYWPRPVTFGFDFHYCCASGNWAFGWGGRGPCGGWFAFGWGGGGHGGYVYHHGGYWGGGWWGNARYSVNNVNIHVNHVQNIYNINRGGAHGRVAEQHPANNVRDRTPGAQNRLTERRPTDNARDRVPQARDGVAARKPDTISRKPNNVLTDKSGNVYRRNLDGWEQNNGREWTRTPTTKPTAGGVVRPLPTPGGGTVAPRPTIGGGTETPRPTLGGGTVTPRPTIGGGTVTPQPTLGGGTVTPRPTLGGGTVTPQPTIGGGTVTPRPTQELDRDFAARAHGAARTETFGGGGFSRPSSDFGGFSRSSGDFGGFSRSSGGFGEMGGGGSDRGGFEGGRSGGGRR